MFSIRFLSVALIGALLPAQATTLVVDSAGTGDFLDLPAAVAAAQPGDILFLIARSQGYTPTPVTKGITLMGEPVNGQRATINGDLIIDSLPASGPPATVVNVQAGQQAINGGIFVTNCGSSVVLEDIVSWGDSVIDVSDCVAVHMRNVESLVSAGGHRFLRSTAFLQDCEFSAFHWLAVTPPALWIENSAVTMVRSQAYGSFDPGHPTPAVILLRSTLSVGPESELYGIPGDVGGDALSTISYDPRVNQGAGIVILGPLAQVPGDRATLTVSPLVSGSTSTLELRGPSLTPFLVFVGQPITSPVIIIPGFPPLWFDLGSATQIAGSSTNAAGEAMIGLPVPVNLVHGVPFVFQGFLPDPQQPNGILATNPSAATLIPATPPPANIIVRAQGQNSFNANTDAGFFSVEHTATSSLAPIVAVNLDWIGSSNPGQATMVFDTDQLGLADRFDAGNSAVAGCMGTFRNGSAIASGLIFAGTQPSPCDPGANTGWLGSNPTVPGSFRTIDFQFNSFGPGTRLEFDLDTDGGAGISGDAMAGMVVTVLLADSTVLSGELAVSPGIPSAATLRF